MNINEQANFIWSIADLLRGDFKQSEYGKVILPFTVLRRFDCVLATSKAKILEANKTLTVSNKRPIFKRMTGHDYYNISQFDFEKLMDDSNAIEANLRDYINGFSEDVREIMDSVPSPRTRLAARLRPWLSLVPVCTPFATIRSSSGISRRWAMKTSLES